MDAVDALVRLGGTADAGAIIALSSRRRLRNALRRGEVRRVARNRYCLPTAERGREAAAKLYGVVSHLNAAALWGWEIKAPPEEPHVSVRRDRKITSERRIGVQLHWVTFMPEDIDGVATAKLRTVIDCAKDLPFDEALAVADSALRHGDVTEAELLSATAALRGRHAARARRVAACADKRAKNPFESALRAIAIEAGWRVVPQHPVDTGGVIVHPDLADLSRGVVLEADSWTWHASKEAHERDCWRYNALVVAGWTVLRFTWQQVMLSPAYVRSVLAALDRPSGPATRGDTPLKAA